MVAGFALEGRRRDEMRRVREGCRENEGGRYISRRGYITGWEITSDEHRENSRTRQPTNLQIHACPWRVRGIT